MEEDVRFIGQPLITFAKIPIDTHRVRFSKRSDSAGLKANALKPGQQFGHRASDIRGQHGAW